MSIRRMASDVSARQPSGKTDSIMEKGASPQWSLPI